MAGIDSSASFEHSGTESVISTDGYVLTALVESVPVAVLPEV